MTSLRHNHRMNTRLPNILLIGVDSLRADRMSCYGYPRLTTPHLDRLAARGVRFARNYSGHIPTTSSYATMLTGLDSFSHRVVALRHQGGLPESVSTLPEILRTHGYSSSCIGFSGNPSSRGFDTYLDYEGWGRWSERPARKAENLNEKAIPELERLAADGKPFLLFLRHMDPHSPYLPPQPFENLFYSGDPCDPEKSSLRPALEFKPFKDYFSTWMPPGATDAAYIEAQYDGALAYMDACIQRLLVRLDELNLTRDTLIILTGDHGETLMEHDCYFDHHGLYDCTLHVPLIIVHPSAPAGQVVEGITLHQDLVPTILELLGLEAEIRFDGRSLLPLVRGERPTNWSDFYITECTWMRKHGWRTPEWKLIRALEPDFHFKPPVELYNLLHDPEEEVNLAEREWQMVDALSARMDAWIAQREAETGMPNPMLTNLNWHGSLLHEGPFTSSEQAYETLHIGDPAAARKLQAAEKK